MDKIDYWKFCEWLSLVQAALLIVGEDPSNCEEYVLEWEHHKRPEGFNAVFAALKHDIISGSLRARIRKSSELISLTDEDERFWFPESFTDYLNIIISVDDLKKWLRSRGVKNCFFYNLDELEGVPPLKSMTYEIIFL